MGRCFWACLAKIPWWAWLVLVAAGVVFALIVWFTGGAGIFGLPLWVSAVLAGLGPIATTMLYCIQGCARR